MVADVRLMFCHHKYLVHNNRTVDNLDDLKWHLVLTVHLVRDIKIVKAQ